MYLSVMATNRGVNTDGTKSQRQHVFKLLAIALLDVFMVLDMTIPSAGGRWDQRAKGGTIEASTEDQ